MFHGPFHRNGIVPLMLRPHITASDTIEILQRQGSFHCPAVCTVLRPAAEDDLPSVHTSLRTYVDQHVRSPHYLLIVLNDNHGIPDVPKSFQHCYKPLRITRMKPYARFIQNIQRTDEGTAQSRDQIDSLALST